MDNVINRSQQARSPAGSPVEDPPARPGSGAKTAQQLVMVRETQVTFGPVPHALSGDPLPVKSWQMREDQFLLRGEGHHYFLYRKGHGVTVERGSDADLSEESLWLNGSVYSAIASMNGFVPIHASAVSANDRVFAFTGPGGAGKSTLVAALAKEGLPMFCDDTLVLDLAEPDHVKCLPGHKRLKLRPDALKMTGAAPLEKVSVTVDKFYALPHGESATAVLPLCELIFLEEGPGMTITPLVGAARLASMHDDHQTARLHAAAHKLGPADRFEHLNRLARRIRMSRFVRPRDPHRFAEGVAKVATYIARHSGDLS
ncbi:MAG: hypothetical protein ABIP07_06600 [Sphingomicrobium sp.]